MASRRFLAVVGDSGSGKSSLVKAGLIPALHRADLLAFGSQASHAEQVLNSLASARLITVTTEGVEPRGTSTLPKQELVEVAHEALIREWPRLLSWVNQDRNDLRIERSIIKAAAEWERYGRDNGSLLQGARLAEAEEWAAQYFDDLPAAAAQLLQASIAARDERVRVENERLLANAEKDHQVNRMAEQYGAAVRTSEDLINLIRSPLSLMGLQLNQLLKDAHPEDVLKPIRTLQGLWHSIEYSFGKIGILADLEVGRHISLKMTETSVHELRLLLLALIRDINSYVPPGRNVTFHLEVDASDERVIMVSLELFQIVLMNVLDNALKYSFANSSVKVAVQEEIGSSDLGFQFWLSNCARRGSVGLSTRLSWLYGFDRYRRGLRYRTLARQFNSAGTRRQSGGVCNSSRRSYHGAALLALSNRASFIKN